MVYSFVWPTIVPDFRWEMFNDLGPWSNSLKDEQNVIGSLRSNIKTDFLDYCSINRYQYVSIIIHPFFVGPPILVHEPCGGLMMTFVIASI